MKVIRLNIERLQFRRDFIGGILFNQGVPFEKMKIWKGKDAEDYEKTYQVFEAAIEDGFGHFQRYIDMNTDDWLPIGTACQHWDVCRICRYIKTVGEPVIYLHDDQCLPKGYEAYLKLFEDATRIAARDQTDLKYISLSYCGQPDMQYVSEIDIVEPEKYLMRGTPACGTDLGAIITPAGASWLLETYAHHDIHPILECGFETMTKKGIDLGGIYTVVADGEWLHGVPFEIAPSNLYTDPTCATPRISVERTRRDSEVFHHNDADLEEPENRMIEIPKKQLGKTDIHATVIGLGTCVHPHERMHALTLPIEQRVDTIRYALAQGINYIDTAPAYGSPNLPEEHKSEIVLGEALRDIPRDSFYLNTKSHDLWVSDKFENLSRLQEMFETSLQRLDIEYFDNYLLHDIPVVLETPDAISECVKEIQKLKEQGLIRGGIGVGTVEIEVAEKVLEQGWADIIQLGGGHEVLGGQRLNEAKPDFVLTLLNQDVAFINCQLFCCRLETPNFHKEALEYSLMSPIVDISMVGMHTKEEIDANIEVVCQRGIQIT